VQSAHQEPLPLTLEAAANIPAHCEEIRGQDEDSACTPARRSRRFSCPHGRQQAGLLIARSAIMEANAAVAKRDAERERATKILLAIDESPCSQAAVEAVLKQFSPEQSDVRVLHVDEWPKGLPTYLAFAEGPAAVSNVVSMHNERWRRAEGLIARAAHRLTKAKFRATADMRSGDARHEILAYAAEWRPDVIVVGSHGRHGAERFLLGSVSESVVRHADCSVEVVRGASAADSD
jgi:nucleotide-binding universal stress UspA family protein